MKMQDLPIKDNLYQVFLLKSAVPVPLHFAMHGWFLLNRKGKIDRWEFGKFGVPFKSSTIGVMHNYLKPLQGMNKYGWKRTPRAEAKLIHFIEGDEKSLARNMANFIQLHSEDYPFKNTYRYTGPNSNTYLQWVLNHFPNSDFKLPWNAFGKGFNGLKNV